MKKKQISPGKSTQFLEEEIVADWLAKNTFTTQEAVNNLVDNNKTLGQKILEWTKSQIKKFSNTKDKNDNIKMLKKTEKMFYNAIQETNNYNKNIDNVNKKLYSEENKTNNSNNDIFSAVIAPYYNTPITNENFNEIKNKVHEQFTNNAKNIASALNIDIDKTSVNIGGFTFSEGETAGQFVKELSYTFQLKNASQQQADMFAMLMGDLGYENQEAVISSNYLDATATNADAVEHIIKFKDVNGVEKLLEKVGINDYTLDLTNNEVKILDFEMGNYELVDKIDKFEIELGGNYNEHKWNKIASRYMDRKYRQKAYRTWLGTNEASESNRLLRDYTIEASNRVNQEIAKIEKQQSIKETTQNKEVRYSKEKSINEIKLEAELKQKKVYSFKEVDTMVNDFIN